MVAMWCVSPYSCAVVVASEFLTAYVHAVAPVHVYSGQCIRQPPVSNGSSHGGCVKNDDRRMTILTSVMQTAPYKGL